MNRMITAIAVITCHAFSAPDVLAQPGPEMPYGRLSLPTLSDGSHDFDFLEGAWQLRQGRLVEPLSGPNAAMHQSFGRLVARRPEVGGVTIEWEARLSDTTRISGFARMSYDPKTKEWTIREADSPTAAPEPPVVGHFENGNGLFYGLREYEGHTVLVRLVWRVTGLGGARLDRAFSIDGGASWETNWIMHLWRQSTAPPRRSPREVRCCGNVEVTWYTVPPGKEDELIRLFARESFAMGDSFPVQDIALLRDIKHPTTFALVRGFSASQREMRDFYEGLPWAAHRATLERAHIRADSVDELRADLGAWGFSLGDRMAPGQSGSASGVVVATMYARDWRRGDSYLFGPFFAQSVVPRMNATGARTLGVFTTEDFRIGGLWNGQRMVSTIPGRPLPPQRYGVTVFSWFADTASYERHRQAMETDPFWRETVLPRLTRFITSTSTSSMLVPVGRSREFRDVFERPTP
jgi:hypothetical protein